MSARNIRKLRKRSAQILRRSPRKNVVRFDSVTLEHVERDIELAPRRVLRKSAQQSGEGTGDAGGTGDCVDPLPRAKDLRRQRKQR